MNHTLRLLAAALAAFPLLAEAQDDGRPKVRAITAFVRVERERAPEQLREAAAMLRGARASFQKDGWQVETVRVATQPFPEYTRGLARAPAFELLKELGAVAGKEEFMLA